MATLCRSKTGSKRAIMGQIFDAEIVSVGKHTEAIRLTIRADNGYTYHFRLSNAEFERMVKMYEKPLA